MWGSRSRRRTTTRLAEAWFSGTATDAVVVGCDPSGDPTEYTDSATTVGAAARACTRDAVLRILRSRYPDGDYPATVDDAEYGVRTTASVEVFRL